MRERRSTRWSGFTLIELLIVVAIIAILAAIAIPNFLEAQTRSKVSRVKADMRSVVTALEAYFTDHNAYPPCDYIIMPTVQTTQVKSGGGGTAPVNPPILRLIPITTPIAYITSIFQDPFNVESSTLVMGWAKDNPRDAQVLFYWGGPWHDAVARAATDSTLFAEMPENIDMQKNFTLLSFSPDKDFDALDSPMGAVGIGTTTWPQTIQKYDPTNGTISDGDVVRTRYTNF